MWEDYENELSVRRAAALKITKEINSLGVETSQSGKSQTEVNEAKKSAGIYRRAS